MINLAKKKIEDTKIMQLLLLIEGVNIGLIVITTPDYEMDQNHKVHNSSCYCYLCREIRNIIRNLRSLAFEVIAQEFLMAMLNKIH